MAITDPTDTLAYHQSRALTTPRNMSAVPISSVSAAINAYQNTSAGMHQAYPEAEALWFYGLNHGMSFIQSQYAPLEPLDPMDATFVNEYHLKMGQSAVRAFYYLLLICVREARHNKSLAKDKANIATEFGYALGEFHASGGGEDGVHKKLLSQPPLGTIGNLTRSLCWVFYNSQWTHGYGGKAWGAVADCLNRFVHGNTTAEMMLDTVWTLAHNNGPIFNKGHFYHVYNGEIIIKLLDVQRSGQIPEMILYHTLSSNYANAALKEKMQFLDARFPGKIGKYVDWYAVEALGSVNSYHNEKTIQLSKYGPSLLASEAEKKAAAIQKAKEQAVIDEKLKHIKSFFVISPKENGGYEEVKKIELNRKVA